MLKNSSILITGGTGSFGHTFIPMTLEKYNPNKIVVFFSRRDEAVGDGEIVQRRSSCPFHDWRCARQR